MSDLRSLLRDLPGPDEQASTATRSRAASVLRPAGALARLDEIAVWLAGWQRTPSPSVDRPAAIVFAADHGVTADGVSAYPGEVTAAMLEALNKGVATATAFADVAGISVSVVDAGVGRPTANLRLAPAMTADEFDEAVHLGAAAVNDLDADLLVFGEMGIGNTTAAASVAHALFGGVPEDWTGAGTGLDDEGVARKAAIVGEAVDRIADLDDPIEVLRELGGRELAAIAGATAAARRRSIPVLLDGFIVTAAVAALALAHSGALDHCWAAHRSAEPGHHRLLSRLGKDPLLELDMRLGEGSGALLAVPLVRMAAAGVTNVATFEEWGLA